MQNKRNLLYIPLSLLIFYHGSQPIIHGIQVAKGQTTWSAYQHTGLFVQCKPQSQPPKPEENEAPSKVSSLEAITDELGKTIIKFIEGTDDNEVKGFVGFRGPVPNLDPDDPLHQPYLTQINNLPNPVNPGYPHQITVENQIPGIKQYYQIAQTDGEKLSGFEEVEGIVGGMPPIPGIYWGKLIGTTVADGTPVDALENILNGSYRSKIDTKKTVATPSGDVNFSEVTNDSGISYYILEIGRYQNGIPIVVNCPTANTGAETTLGTGSFELNLTSPAKSLYLAPKSLSTTNIDQLPTQMAKGIEWLLKMPNDIRTLYTNLPLEKQREYLRLPQDQQLDFLLNQYKLN